MRARALLALFSLLALAGCGDSTKTVTTSPPTSGISSPSSQHVTRTTSTHLCPPGESYMGCSVLPPTPAPGSRLVTPLRQTVSGAKFPDVSMWQGTVGWGSVAAWQRSHGWPTGGIFKMGEGTHRDPRAAENAAGTRGLSWRGGYWFVRNVGCDTEANAIASAAHDYGIHVVWLDLEVPESGGYGVCLTPRLRHAGFLVGEYGGPGTNPGGMDTSAPLWEATYGSGFSPMWQPVVAWQCSDGVYGCVTDVPGIGRDDVSIDFGISKLSGPPPPPPDPFRFMDKTVRRFAGGARASEYNTVKTWAGRHCQNPVRRPVCVTSRAHLQLLVNRLWFQAHHPLRNGKPTWSLYHRGQRFLVMWRDLHKH